MTKIVVIDHNHSKVCGIYDLGLRLTERLNELDGVDAVHVACGSVGDYLHASEDVNVAIINFRPDLMPWWMSVPERTYGPIRLAIMHNYEDHTANTVADNLLAMKFDWVLALDPTLVTSHSPHSRIVTSGRPLPHTHNHVEVNDSPSFIGAHIGSFGFAFPHKGFVDVAREIVTYGEPAMYNLHMPEAYFNGVEGRQFFSHAIYESCVQVLAGNPGARLRWTYDHIDGARLITRLRRNDINCLLYAPGQPDAGLSSALDYVIAARQPILVSEATMFRHGLGQLARWPTCRIGDVIRNQDEHRRRIEQLEQTLVEGFRKQTRQMLERIL